MSRRTERVGDQIRAAIAEIIRRDLSDPRVAMASVSEVAMSADLKHARVWVSVLGSDEGQRQEAVGALTHAAGFIKRQLGRRLRLKAVPELAFVLDRGAEHSQRIADLLEGLDSDDDQQSS